MITIPTSTTTIGSPEQHLDAVATSQHYPRAWFEDETPQHTASIDAFSIDPVPVTNAAYAEFTDATGHVTAAERRGYGLAYGRGYWTTVPGVNWRHPHPDLDAVGERPYHPVVHLDHADASAYAVWAGKRLPTEVEWEFAAHGRQWSPWPWGDEWDCHRANTAEYWAAGYPIHDLDTWKTWWCDHYAHHDIAPATTVVGALANGASPFGVLDMAGNVTEWTASPYRLYAHDRRYDPGYHAVAGHGHIAVRGGSWKSFRWQARTSERIACDPSYSAPDLGFRCARDLPESATPHHPTTR
ncbi:formylglycine-generating enzyme family protein [Nocardia sputi]|uniref:formylglycine-generating enzyme family protein n=1 Tax=Nocardia sputi TaxID=2943705 RepID=UPI0020C15793|nr:SUMF1/EgtB/PvdO family nonheme iron enzyme [Nocardia sputi]